jgi:biopolymer transport protein ExbB
MILYLGYCAAVYAETPSEIPSVRAAYLREKRELTVLRDSLQRTLHEIRQKHAQRKQALEDEIKNLMRNATYLRNQADLLEEKISKLKQRESSSAEHGDTLAATLRLAANTLKRDGAEISAPDRPEQALRHIVTSGIALLQRFSQIYREAGRFFAIDGQSTVGDIFHIGRVAALGLSRSQDIGGALQTAPDGGLRLVQAPNAQMALDAVRSLKRGQVIGALPVFIFDPLKPTQAPQTQRDLYATLQAGGPIAWLIMGLALFSLLLIFERLATLLSLANWRSGNILQIAQLSQRGKSEQALTLTHRMGAIGQVLRQIIPQIREQREEQREYLEHRTSEYILKLMPKIERSMAMLSVIITVAPLLGLLGTVTGMISTFDVITIHGTGDPKLLSGGISEALITTKLGLAVAVPLLLIRSFFSRWADSILEHLQTQIIAFLNVVFADHTKLD